MSDEQPILDKEIYEIANNLLNSKSDDFWDLAAISKLTFLDMEDWLTYVYPEEDEYVDNLLNFLSEYKSELARYIIHQQREYKNKGYDSFRIDEIIDFNAEMSSYLEKPVISREDLKKMYG